MQIIRACKFDWNQAHGSLGVALQEFFDNKQGGEFTSTEERVNV